ncbi:Rgg/GadR/MutR family transcriptional regulator [Lactococcus garvieae]|uniref:Transcriptional activator, Rgg/GadR/MutR family, C-terminal domain-containing protein n=1 Tax=Lactococcus garvieae TaxID=1363 RepID=A0A1I4J7L7_9LACT|nr:Rgg/GadR/MutR family transcriptional regulator [Lactococcus garvieae]SFL62086.1 transcriptional activator, Rgg/GadR/MutR family, C-terminal domain-containing protein [Lactococcus garvieae]
MKANNSGKVFKKLRKQRGFKLTSFQDNNISPATISNFENGKTKIAFDKLQIMLRTLSVSLEEFLIYTDEVDIDENSVLNQLIREITKAILTDNHTELSLYQSKAIQLHEYHLYLAIKGTQQSLELDEIGILSDYFDNIKYWRKIDLYTLCLSVKYLKARQNTYLLEGFFMEEKQYYSSEITFFHVACCIISSLISSNNQKTAKHFINYLSRENYPYHTMYTINLLNFVNGYWKAKFESYSEGLDDLKQALYLFEQLEKPMIFNYYENLFKKHLKDISNYKTIYSKDML